MSIYKRPDAETYSYDFRLRGDRYSGNTGCPSKRAAERHVAELKAQIRQKAAGPRSALTIHAALDRWWMEVGQHLSDTATPARALLWLGNHIPVPHLLTDLNNKLVADLVARRRGETVRRTQDGGTVDEQLVTPATVNRHVTQMLRRVHRRAARVWEEEVRPIAWSEHMLREAEERVREASAPEEEALLEAIPEDYAPALLFALLTGCRRAEIVDLTWSRVDFFNREFRVVGKGERERTVPMTAEVYDLLWGLKDHHTDSVFTYKAQRAWQGRSRGKRYPITKAGFNTAWRRHARPLLKDFRFHDCRHTAATRLVRATGNLKLAQRLLGHASVATTTRYAHVTHDDLRAGLDAVHRAKTPTQIPTQPAHKSAN